MDLPEGNAGVKGNERADALLGKAVVDVTVMVRHRVHLIRAMTVKIQNEDDTDLDNVHIQRMIVMAVTRGRREK